jgi:hypothetical protein
LESSHLLSGFFFALVLVGEDERERLRRQVASADEPLVGLLDQQGPGEADHRRVVGEDPDDVGAPTDLAVDPLERIRIPYETSQMRPVTHDRPDAQGVQAGEYGATVRDGASGSKEPAGQAAERSMGFEPALVLGRPCDSPGCA